MKAIVIDRWLKTVDEMQVDPKAPEPELSKNQVLVEVKAVGLNFFDILQIMGKYQIKPAFPFVLGAEFAGVVLKVHPSAKTDLKPGDRVFGSAHGTFAERVAASLHNVRRIPNGMSFAEAAGLFVTYPTSYAALVLRADLKKGEWCLVHGASGGVGMAAVQIAKALGAKVIATGSSDEKLKIATKCGADYVVNYKHEDWAAQVKKITGGHGVDVVYDPVGLIEISMKCIAWNGRLIVIGFAAGKIEQVAMNRVLLKNCTITGLHWGEYTKHEPDTVNRVWEALLHMFRQGMLRPVVYEKVYGGLDNVKNGLKAIASRQTYGKVVVTTSKESKL